MFGQIKRIMSKKASSRHPATNKLLVPLICEWLSTAQEYSVSEENFMEELADG